MTSGAVFGTTISRRLRAPAIKLPPAQGTTYPFQLIRGLGRLKVAALGTTPVPLTGIERLANGKVAVVQIPPPHAAPDAAAKELTFCATLKVNTPDPVPPITTNPMGLHDTPIVQGAVCTT